MRGRRGAGGAAGGLHFLSANGRDIPHVFYVLQDEAEEPEVGTQSEGEARRTRMG